MVVASSVAAVIGTDIKGVCSYMQEQVSAKLIAFEQGGFRGDYSVGLTEAYKLLVKELPVDEPEPQPDTVNLIASRWVPIGRCPTGRSWNGCWMRRSG